MRYIYVYQLYRAHTHVYIRVGHTCMFTFSMFSIYLCASLYPLYRNFLTPPNDLNRFTLHFRKRMYVNEDHDDTLQDDGRSYGMMNTRYHGINLSEERAYSQEPDKEFKFYLGTLLLLFLIIYAVQAIMVHR